MNKNIFLIGPCPPPYGGVAIYISMLCDLLTQIGLNYELKITQQQGDSLNNVVLPDFNSVFRNFRSITKNDTCLDSSSFFLEYIEYRSGNPLLAWLLIKLFKRFRWVKIIHDGTLPSRYKEFNFIRKSLFHLSIKLVDEFVVVSDDLRQWLKHDINVKQNIALIKSSLPIPDTELKSSLSAELSSLISQHSKWVCSLGTFNPAYGFKHIADAVDYVRKESGMDIGLLLIDGGFAIDVAEHIRNEVLKQREWIRVLTSIPHHSVLQLFKKVDVFVRGVVSESYGLSRIEALWCGTPVVATRTGEMRGMLLYDFGDEQQLIQQIKEAIFNPSVKDAIFFWAEHFHKEAEKNLKDLISIIKI